MTAPGLRPTIQRTPTEANLRRARKHPEEIKARTCNEVFDEFIAHCESRAWQRAIGRQDRRREALQEEDICAFEYGYRDHPEKPNPAKGLKGFRITKNDRPVIDPFTIPEAEALIAAIHQDSGEAQR